MEHGKTFARRRSVDDPLSGEPLVQGTGPEGSLKCAIVGEYPSRSDAAAGTAYSGTDKDYLNSFLAQAGFYRPGIYVTTVLNRACTGRGFTIELALKAQLEGFRDEVRWLYKRGVRLIVAMGELSLQAFGIKESMSTIRGSLVEVDPVSCTPTEELLNDPLVVLPTFSLNYVVRTQRVDQGKGKVDLISLYLTDLKKAHTVLTEGYKRPKEDFNLTPSYQDIKVFVEEAITTKALVAVDIESTSLKANEGKVIVIGLALDGERAISVPFLTDYGKPYFAPAVELAVKQLMNTLFTTCPLLLQNALFDVPYLREHGFKVDMAHVAEDTLLLHHVVSPELPHKLGFIASVYGTTPYWKEDFLHRDGRILDMDQREMRRYNLRDTVVLHQVLPGLKRDLDELPHAAEVYRKESLALLGPVDEMQQTGVMLDKHELRTYERHLKATLEQTEAELKVLGNLPNGFSLASNTDLRLFLFNEMDPKYAKLIDITTKRKGTKLYTELELATNIRDNTKPLWIPTTNWNPRRTKEGSIAVNAQGRLGLQRAANLRLAMLDKYKRHTEEHLTERGNIEKLLKWLEVYQIYTETEKLLSTYTKFETDARGRVHTSYLISGTATGRLSSRAPNLQNLPKKNKEIRRMFVPAAGYVILAADYSNLEVKVLAYETLEPNLINVVDSGKNVHDMNTGILFNLTPSDEGWELARRAAKIFMFGSLAYGGGDNEIYEKILLEVPKLKLTFAAFREAKERWMQANLTYSTWRERITRDVTQTRQVANAFGRVRTFYGSSRDITKEALNFPIQSAAASIINRATVRVWKRLREGSYVTRLQAQIHDELRFEVHKSELHEVAAIVREEMQRPIKMHNIDRCFDCEISVGPNWADLAPYQGVKE